MTQKTTILPNQSSNADKIDSEKIVINSEPTLPVASDSLDKERYENSLAQVPSGQINKASVSDIIQKYSKGTPVLKAEDLIDAANKYNIDLRLLLAVGIMESNLGTAGERSKQTKNPFNYGNNDQNQNQYYNSFREGVFAFAEGLDKNFANSLESFWKTSGAHKDAGYYCEKYENYGSGETSAKKYALAVYKLGKKLEKDLYVK